ncbi:MAG: diguanylate cyclase, partial [Curvibacter sp.]
VQARTLNRRALDERLAMMVSAQTGVRTIVVINHDGDIIASSRPELQGQGLNFRDSERYNAIRSASDTRMLHISPPFVTPLGHYAVSAGVMVADAQGRFNGYVLAILDPDYFRILLESLLFADDVHASLIHADGKVVFRLPDPEQITGTDLAQRPDSLFGRFMASGQRSDIVTGLAAATGVERTIAFARILPTTMPADNPLVVAIDRQVAALYAPWYRELRFRVALFAVILFVSVFGLYIYQVRHRAIEELEETQEAQREATEQRILQLNAELEGKVRQRTAELERANAELRHLSRHDVLTGVANRMAANERLHGEYLRMRRTGSVYAVLMIDVDHFKRINDTHGHEAGDEVLRRVAKTLAANTRESDLLARFGGEEFILLLPDTGLEAAQTVAEKLRHAVASHPDRLAGPITVSIGLACATPQDADENAALKLADHRLYEAKAAGRNRVVPAAA